jgi:flagellum-specific ATP synthase
MMDHPFVEMLRNVDLVARTGRVTKILPGHIEADGPNVPLGALCIIEGQSATESVAEVIGINGGSVVLAPFDDDLSTFSGARVIARAEVDQSPVGDNFSGRAVDALGRPIDGLGPIAADRFDRARTAPPAPMARTSPSLVLETGIRAIDGLLTLGQGQRVGVFAASGVGKTTLITQLANQVEADRCVICMVGERGREVEQLWSKDLTPARRERTTVVAATSDESAAMRVRAGHYALELADFWRRRGEHVLLVLDSVTRLAMAMREIGLAAGEPPTVRAYTPRVFSAIPKMVERCGALKSGGSITAIMTVLSETDDIDDPISEMMKSLLDGHILLSRELAERGQYPAIDVPRSISRLSNALITDRHRLGTGRAVRLLSIYEASKTLIESGIYVPGSDPDIDDAVAKRAPLQAFLKQRSDARAGFSASVDALSTLVGMT